MSYMRHDAVIVTGAITEVKKAHKKARKFFSEKKYSLVSNIVAGCINGYASFLIAPDGSKEGWEESEHSDRLREKFLDAICKLGVEWVHISYGGDEPKNSRVVDFG